MADITNTPSETTTGESSPRADTLGARLAAKRAAKAARKAAQRGTDNPGEEVTEKLMSANDWLDQHKAKLWGSVVALVAIGGALIAYSKYQAGEHAIAGKALLEAISTSEGVVTNPEDPTPEEEPLVPTFESAAQRDEKALTLFRDAAKKVPSADAAAWAKLGEANMLLATGKFEEAARAYDAAREAAVDEEFLQMRAIEGAGYALEAQKKPADALKRFEELSSHARGSYKVLGDFHRGRLLAAMGKSDEAIKVLQAVVKANAAKPASESQRFATEVAAAQTLLEELGVAPEAKQPTVDISALGGGPGAGGQANQISEQVMEALRKQLAAQKAGASK